MTIIEMTKELDLSTCDFWNLDIPEDREVNGLEDYIQTEWEQ